MKIALNESFFYEFLSTLLHRMNGIKAFRSILNNIFRKIVILGTAGTPMPSPTPSATTIAFSIDLRFPGHISCTGYTNNLLKS